MCAQRKAGRRQRARLRLLSVPFPWSLAVHHQSLASTLRKTKRLRRRLVEWYLLAGPCSLYTADSIKVTLGIGDWGTRICLAIRYIIPTPNAQSNLYLISYRYCSHELECGSTDPLSFEEMFSDVFKPLAWVFSVRVNIVRTVTVCKIYSRVFELKEGKSVRLNCISYLIIGNSMICSDIWHKYHQWYFKTVIRNFMSR